MNRHFLLSRTSWIAAFLAVGACAAQAAPPVVDIIGNIPLATYNANISPQTYRDWGNEPFIAVNPTNPNQVVVSSFAYSFINGGGDASLWVSGDGGTTWNLRFPVNSAPALASPPGGSSGPSGPNDQAWVYDSSGVLHTAMLTNYNNGSAETSLNVYHGTTSNPNTTASFTWTNPAASAGASGTSADQPWMTISGTKVFVGYDVFSAGVSQRVNESTNSGATFTSDQLVGKSVGSFVNPGLRLASDTAGNAYAIWGVGTSSSAGVQNVTYHLNRNSTGGAWDYTNNATADAAGGLVIDSGNSTQIDDGTRTHFFGNKNELRGDITAVASDALGNHVYAVYGKQDITNVDRIWLAEFHPVAGNLVERPTPVVLSIPGQRSALPSVAVTTGGVIGVMYDTSPSADHFEIHLAESADFGLTFTDQVLYTFATTGFNLQTSNFPDSQRLLGDYQYLMASGNSFYGTFVATGNTNAGGINTTNLIDPFFFTVSVPEPSLLLPLLLTPLLLRNRMRRMA